MLNLSHGNLRPGKDKKTKKEKKEPSLAHFCLLISVAIVGIPSSQCFATELPSPLMASDYHEFSPERAKIGQLLFYDKILSGNQNISCGTCHHPRFGSSDGLSLGIGEGGQGVGHNRTPGFGSDRIKKRIPRNSSALWNLGAKEFKMLFHDGRLSVADDFGNKFNSPAEERLPRGLKTLLGTQSIFPMASQFEMAGNPKENEIAGALHDRIDYVWPILAKRVRTIPKYGEMFVNVFPDVHKPEDVTIVHIGEALSAYIALEFESRDSPFDDFLTGDFTALDDLQKKGMELFYGKARCFQCHSGPFLTDQQFHALAIPPFGPGRTRHFDPFVRDVGRMGESDRIEDAYRFRTPSLRNVALTPPYGHNGAYPDLEGIIRHHLNPLRSIKEWTWQSANLPNVPWLAEIDFLVWDDQMEMERYKAKIDIKSVELTDREISYLIEFMHSLTGKSSQKLRFGIPESVPSGLLVDK